MLTQRMLIAPLLVILIGCGNVTSGANIHRLVSTINEDPDPFHGDMTPSGAALVDIGVEAIPPVLDLMLSDDFLTRLRASSVIERIIDKMFGFTPGRGFKTAVDKTRCEELWARLGKLDPASSRDDRKQAIARWRQWYYSVNRS